MPLCPRTSRCILSVALLLLSFSQFVIWKSQVDEKIAAAPVIDFVAVDGRQSSLEGAALLHASKARRDKASTEYDVQERSERAEISASYPSAINNALPRFPHPYPHPPDWPTRRQDRFPSVKERIQLYMANFYHPPCSDAAKVRCSYHDGAATSLGDDRSTANDTPWLRLQVRDPTISNNLQNFTLIPSITSDHLFSLNDTNWRACLDENEYCRDVRDYIVPLWKGYYTDVPILLQFGDLPYALNLPEDVKRPTCLPFFKKYRQALSKSQLEDIMKRHEPGLSCMTESRGPRWTSANSNSEVAHSAPHVAAINYTPIIWRLETQRHYEKVPKVDERDCSWARKFNRAIFWGAPTNTMVLRSNSTSPHEDESPRERCLSNPRCRLVLTHANSSLVKAKLVRTRGRWPDVIDGVNITGGRIPMQKIIRYKALIMLEGNDVSSGLKWALRSNSVVMMPRPTRTSWAMEERLEAYKHYVPLSDTLEDVEEQMKWIILHDEEAYWIAQRGKLWIQDLLEHPDAASDNLAVNQGIMGRYRAHFEYTH